MDVIRVAADDEATWNLHRGSHVKEVDVWLVPLARNTQLTSSVTGSIKQVDKCHPLSGVKSITSIAITALHSGSGRSLHTYRIRSGFDYRKYLGSTR